MKEHSLLKDYAHNVTQYGVKKGMYTHDDVSSTKSSLLNCTYSSISTSRLPRFTNEMRLANSFVVSFTIKFLCTTSTTKLAF